MKNITYIEAQTTLTFSDERSNTRLISLHDFFCFRSSRIGLDCQIIFCTRGQIIVRNSRIIVGNPKQYCFKLSPSNSYILSRFLVRLSELWKFRISGPNVAASHPRTSEKRSRSGPEFLPESICLLRILNELFHYDISYLCIVQLLEQHLRHL